ncbi:MAG: F0F1 ATP synthase subunit A [Saprospirales bacterium]|nr:F0F1 ATP synthase subunit A [Saprospirales bacterium]
MPQVSPLPAVDLFFILSLNLIGQTPFFPGSANVTGNLGVTLVLALFTFLVVNLNGKKNYWKHIFWMPGVPAPIKLILTPWKCWACSSSPLPSCFVFLPTSRRVTSWC